MAEIVVEVATSLCAEADVKGTTWVHPDECRSCGGAGVLDVILVTLDDRTEATFERNVPWPDRG